MQTVRLAFILVIFATADWCSAQSIEMEYVYLIESSECVSLPDVRVQTGFRLQGISGIVTSLHGVIGCSHITARRPESNESYTNLSIERVDVERDVAILHVPLLQGTEGLTSSHKPGKKAVKVIGHPQAMPSLWEMPIQLENLSPRPLWAMLPPSLHDAIRRRNSPSTAIRVFRLNGDLQPGHSGAPVVDSAGQVVAIGSGGLGDGTLGIAWGIPLQEIEWVPASVRARDLEVLSGEEPTHVFSHRDPDGSVPEPVVWSQGRGCIHQTGSFDLDRGAINPSDRSGDLFCEAKTYTERYLRHYLWNNSMIAYIGQRDFDRVTLPAIRRASFGRTGFNASRDAAQNKLPSGTVLAVQTNEGRYSKLRIDKSTGDYITFDWLTYALPSEGKSPTEPSVTGCGTMAQLLCGSGQLPGDQIQSFRVIQRTESELTVAVRHNFNPAHGQTFLGAYLLDRDESSISQGFRPTSISPSGETTMNVAVGSGESWYLLVWMYEANRSEAFVCRRFDLRGRWVQ